MSQVTGDEDIDYLDGQRASEKLSQYVDPTTGEALFARRVLLVEGHGDSLAASCLAAKLGKDLDAEGLSIVSCGGKNRIPFFARMCRALVIPFVVLHDEDIYHGDELEDWQIAENRRAPEANARVREAAGEDGAVYLATPTLEAELGIGRTASNKPARILAEMESRTAESSPAALRSAVETLISES